MLQRLNVASDWQRMWNNEVLPYLQAAKVVAGRGIRVDEHPGGTVISELPATTDPGGGGDGDVILAAVVTAPAGGFGVGEAKAITMNTDGTYAITSGGAAISTITPFI